MKTAYPALIKDDAGMYAVYIPDFDGYTEGEDFCDAIEMARDYIGNAIVGPSGDEDNRPPISSTQQAIEKARDSESELDFSTGTVTFVDVDIEAHRAEVRNLSVKKNCTLPQWLEKKAEMAGLNFSQVLQEALKERLKLA